jgi:hypothetical protein
LFDAAQYFKTSDDVKRAITGAKELRRNEGLKFVEKNMERIRDHYNWDFVVSQHESLFVRLASKGEDAR